MTAGRCPPTSSATISRPGSGLLKATAPLKVQPLAFGKSAALKERDAVVVAGFGGPDNASPAVVVSKREFAGNWEYLLDEAIFTAPPHAGLERGGAARSRGQAGRGGLAHRRRRDRQGRPHAKATCSCRPTCCRRSSPISSSSGRTAGPGRPWLGMTTDEAHGHLMVSAVTPEGPAERAGLKRGDMILGVGGAPVNHLPDLYRRLYAQGDAGTVIPLDVLKDSEKRRIEVKSINRLDFLRLKSSF